MVLTNNMLFLSCKTPLFTRTTQAHCARRWCPAAAQMENSSLLVLAVQPLDLRSVLRALIFKAVITVTFISLTLLAQPSLAVHTLTIAVRMAH